MASRPPRKCTIVGDGMVIFGVTEAATIDLRNLKSSTNMPSGRDSLPTTCSDGGE